MPVNQNQNGLMPRHISLLLALTLSVQLAAGPAEAADIVILGEVHDNAHAHLGQAEVIKSLGPSAVVFEMLSPEDADRANVESSEIRKIWEGGRWPGYEIYAPIFEALGPARIIGAASPRATVRSIFHEGPAAAFGAEAARFGLTRPLPKHQQAVREDLQFKAHCDAMPREMMPGMVDVQRFRDARFAQVALDALKIHGPPIVVITGNGHARNDWGMPAAISEAAPTVTVRTIAFVETEPQAPYDEVRIVPPAVRPDPCEQFR